jgi:hypothetical protein
MSVHTDMLVVTITEQCIDEDRCWTVEEVAEHARVSGSTVF